MHSIVDTIPSELTAIEATRADDDVVSHEAGFQWEWRDGSGMRRLYYPDFIIGWTEDGIH